MQIFLFIIIGVVGGILGGMGMGGGTLLIPLLVVFTSLSQHNAQAINLVAFVPMAIIVIIIHIKNKLIKFQYLLFIALPAIALGIIGSILSKYISSPLLSKIFGFFLIALGIYQFVCAIINCCKKNNNSCNKN